jgi:hypothetical protein
MKYSKDHTIYRYNGKEVPSATTILKILNKPGLVKWANSLGYRRINVDDALDEAADFGTLIHAWIHRFLTSGMFIYIDTGRYPLKDIFYALNNFKKWYDKNNVEAIFSEKKFTINDFGGTVDFYGKVNNKLTIIDFKTSRKIRFTMFIQLALYTILLESHEYKVEQVGIVLCNKHPQNNSYKLISREDLEPYIELAHMLIKIFHLYFDLNEKDDWGDSII